MKRYFITAIGTNIGKTFVTSELAREISANNNNIVALKPVISGFNPDKIEESDSFIIAQAQNNKLTIEEISPYRFAAPLSPDIAAQAENKQINLPELLEFCQKHENSDYLLIEGVGGVMSPIGENFTVLDWIAELDYKVILVAGSYLGAISHTLTAYQVLIQKGLKIKLLIISESENSSTTPEQMKNSLQNFLPQDLPIYIIPRLGYSEKIWKDLYEII